tara:strand:+ start:23572 stop:23844 length:273 start_codon:yes stop_codon:yes gene_type:complete
MTVIARSIQVGSSHSASDLASLLATKLSEAGFEVLSSSCLKSFSLSIFDPSGHPYNWLITPMREELISEGYSLLDIDCFASFCKSIHDAN